MAALDVMRYLEAVQHGDWETGFSFFADDIVLHLLASESGWPGGARPHPALPPTRRSAAAAWQAERRDPRLPSPE